MTGQDDKKKEMAEFMENLDMEKYDEEIDFSEIRKAKADAYNNLSVEAARELPDIEISDMALAAQEEVEL